MKTKIAALIVLLLAIAAFMLMPADRERSETADRSQPVPVGPSKSFETKTDVQAEVEINVTPSLLGEQLNFEVQMTTHSVELDQDLMTAAVLTDSRGREYKPLSWDGGVGGHHLSGTLSFKKIPSVEEPILLKIEGIGGVTRTFVWQL